MRLIDADELLDFINSMHFDDYNLYSEIFDYIDDMPTIDAQPVTHGEWIPSKMNAENKENAEMLGIDIETFLSKAAYCSCCGCTIIFWMNWRAVTMIEIALYTAICSAAIYFMAKTSWRLYKADEAQVEAEYNAFQNKRIARQRVFNAHADEVARWELMKDWQEYNLPSGKCFM